LKHAGLQSLATGLESLGVFGKKVLLPLLLDTKFNTVHACRINQSGDRMSNPTS